MLELEGVRREERAAQSERVALAERLHVYVTIRGHYEQRAFGLRVLLHVHLALSCIRGVGGPGVGGGRRRRSRLQIGSVRKHNNSRVANFAHRHLEVVKYLGPNVVLLAAVQLNHLRNQMSCRGN